MFNLITISEGQLEGPDELRRERLFGYTLQNVIDRLGGHEAPDFEAISKLPCLFMPEGKDSEISRVGSVTRVRANAATIYYEIQFDPDVPPISNATIFENKTRFDILSEGEFNRTHWAIKEADLYRELYRLVSPRRQRPKVFKIEEHESVNDKLVSVMMPFSAEFDCVYAAIKSSTDALALNCRRVDEVWDDPTIIQDVVNLIDRSHLVVCDCTGRNPNVFYEAGIAHTLGREVILLSQSIGDIPFDLRHLRVLTYLPNEQGLSRLSTALSERIATYRGANRFD